MAAESVAVRGWPSLALCLSCAASLPLGAATFGNTNAASISYVPPSIVLEPAERSGVFIDRFFEEASSADGTVFDRFSGPTTQLNWVRRQDTLGYASLARFNASGVSMFATIGLDSLRTAAIEALPVDLWQERWQQWFANFIAGTIGNPEEEHIQLTSISYSAVRSSWENMGERAGIQWGLRPWRTNPYLYFLAHAGRLDGRPLITFEGRAGYTLLGSTKLEGRLTLQLPASFRLAGGASLDLFRMTSDEPGVTHFAVTLERVIPFHGLNPEAVFYVGFQSGVLNRSPNPRQENLIVAGLSKRW